MTKFLRRFAAAVGVLGLLFIVLALSGHVKVVDARLTGTNPTGSSSDTFCVGPKTFEVCADSLGDWIPTTNNTQTLGTSALKFSNVFSTTLTATTVTATNVNASGSITATSNITATGGQVGLTPNTTFTLLTLVPISTGAQVSVQLFTAGALGSAFGNCIASGTTTGAWVWPSTSTNSPARACL